MTAPDLILSEEKSALKGRHIRFTTFSQRQTVLPLPCFHF